MKWREILSIDLDSLFRGDWPPKMSAPFWRLRWHMPRWKKPRRLVSRRKPTWRGPRYLRAGKWRRELQMVTEQLASIVRTNSPMAGGLEAAALDAPKARLQDVLLVLRDDIASGLSISEAMGKQSRFFPRFYTDLVRVGEETGRLYESLSDLSQDLVQILQRGDTIRNYLLYLFAISGMLLQTILILSFKVVPEFFKMSGEFSDYPAESVQMLTVLNDVATVLAQGRTWILIFVAAVVIFLMWKVLSSLFRKRGRFSAIAGRVIMRVPVIRTLFVKRTLVRISLVMEKLLHGGVPLNEAIESTMTLDIDPIYAAAMRRIKQRVENGESIQAAMEPEHFFPASFLGIVSVGESSGLLPEAFEKIARLYQREVIKMEKILIDLIAPVGVVALGCVVLFINLSIFSFLVGLVEGLVSSL